MEDVGSLGADVWFLYETVKTGKITKDMIKKFE